MYSLSDYGLMIADRARMDPYAYALKAAIRPDTVVLDIGAATGIHALLACKFGARHVYAVEPDEAVELARRIAAANGFGDRITFIRDVSSNVSLPEGADVIVSDLRGVLPPFQQHIPTIIDARNRHLAPGGTLIPRRDTLWAAMVEASILYNELVAPWDRPYALDMEAAKNSVLNSWTQDGTGEIAARSLLTEARRWAELDYRTITDTRVRGALGPMPALRDGVAHGFLVWFDAELADGIAYGNGPDSPSLASVYGRAFFPLLQPVPVTAGDSIEFTIDAELCAGGDYTWRWWTRVATSAGPGRVKAEFAQSTELGSDGA